jgi:chromosome segregation ATPase
MGCGSPLGDLFYLADALIAGSYSGQVASYSPAPTAWAQGAGVDSRDDLCARLYRMHGEGQVSDEVFHALRALAERGQLRLADLAVHQARARRGASERGDTAIQNALRGIRSRQNQLQQARAGSEKVLADLEARLSELDECMVAKEQAARQVLAQDEETARQRLAEKAQLASSRERLEAQAQALRADLARLDGLRAQLEAKSAELESMQARSVTAQLFQKIE